MAEDPRRVMIEVFARLGRETQLHLDERHRHFLITDAVIITITTIMIILAVFNVYYVRVLYKDLNGIVSTMDSMHASLEVIKGDMISITGNMKSVDEHMLNMDEINTYMGTLADTMPRVRDSMSTITDEVSAIEGDMGLLNGGMTNINQRFGHMTNSVIFMRENVYQISGPMGSMNQFMP